MRTIGLLLLLIASLTVVPNLLRADVINFETLPDANMFLGGGQNIGTFYSGVNFGTDVTGFNVNDLGPVAFPAHSGNIVAWSASSNTVTISFTQAQSSVGLYYTSLDNLTLTAFDGHGNSIGSIVGTADTDGLLGASNPLFLNGLSDIESITLTGVAQNFIFDDLTFTSQTGPPPAVPEPSTLVLLGTGLLGFVVFTRRKTGVNSD